MERVFPALSNICTISLKITPTVARVAYAKGRTSQEHSVDLEDEIANMMYESTYRDHT